MKNHKVIFVTSIVMAFLGAPGDDDAPRDANSSTLAQNGIAGDVRAERTSRHEISSSSTTAVNAPLVPGKVEVRAGVLEATVAPKRGALPRRR